MGAFKGVDSYHGPEYDLNCGDLGLVLNTDDLYTLLEKTTVLSIHGNHENIGVLKSDRNLRARCPVVMRNGRVREVGGLRVAGIREVISARRERMRELILRETPEGYLSVARSLGGKWVGTLLIHEAPYIPELLPSVKMSPSGVTSLEAIRMVELRLAIGRHVHEDSPEACRISPKTLFICLDSSQLSRRYLVLTVEGGWVDVDEGHGREVLVGLIWAQVSPRWPFTR